MIKSSKWFFQYGRWDLRIGCPKCGKRETFICSLSDVDENNIVDDFRCHNCGLRERLELLGDVDKWVANADIRESNILSITGDTIESVHPNGVVQKKKKLKLNPFYKV